MVKSKSALNFVLVSDLYERVHYALVMASAAAATGRKVRLLVTMGALKALTLEPFGVYLAEIKK